MKKELFDILIAVFEDGDCGFNCVVDCAKQIDNAYGGFGMGYFTYDIARAFKLDGQKIDHKKIYNIIEMVYGVKVE